MVCIDFGQYDSIPGEQFIQFVCTCILLQVWSTIMQLPLLGAADCFAFMFPLLIDSAIVSSVMVTLQFGLPASVSPLGLAA
jgi:hypothetical protein